MDKLHIKNIFFKQGDTSFSYSYSPSPTMRNDVTHLHNTYEMLLFYEGDAQYHIGGNLYHLEKHDLLLIKPSVYHNISLLSSHPYARVVLSFCEKDFPENIASFLQSADSLYHIPDEHPILQLFEAMRASSEILSSEAFNQYFISATTTILLLLPYLQNGVAIKKNDDHSSTFDNILSYIDKNPDKPLNLTLLSEFFFLSKSHISHLFKMKLNTSAMDYINNKKISYAHSLLISGMSPTQVAEKCSFYNYSTFYRLYKNFFGVTPKDYNKQNSSLQK